MNYYMVFCFCDILQIKTTATASLHYNEQIPFHALFLMVRLYSFRLSTPSASIFPIPILLQKNCSYTQEHSEMSTAILPFACATANTFLHKSG